MKNKLVKILSVVLLVGVLVGCFAFSSSAEDSSVPLNVPRFKSGIDRPNLSAAMSYMGTNVPIFEFNSNGIMFEVMQITSDAIYYSGSGIRVQVYSVSDGWKSEYRNIYISDYGNNYTFIRDILRFIYSNSSLSYLLDTYFSSIVSSFDIIIDDISIASFVMPLVNNFGLGSSGTIEYSFDVSGFYSSGSSSSIFNGISFIYDEGDVIFKIGDRYLLYGDSGSEAYFKDLKIHFDNCPLFLRNYFVSYSSYFLGAFPFYVHNSVDLSYMDISLLTDSTSSTRGRFYLDYSVAFDDSYNGYPLNLNSYFCFGGGGSSSVFPGASYANLLSTSGLNLASSIIIPYGSISDNIVSDSVYFIFTSQTTPYYDSQGFTLSKTLEFSIRDSSLFYSSPFNTFDVQSNILVLCNSIIGDTSYTYVKRSGESFLFYPSSDMSVYDIITFEELKGLRVVMLAGSSVSPVWYNVCALNGDLLVYGSGSGDYDSGYDAGYSAGQEYGKQLGIAEGRQEGYDKGFEVAKDIYGDDNGGIIGQLLSAPGDAFDKLVLYESNGITISIWDVFITLICCTLFIWFLKMFAGG